MITCSLLNMLFSSWVLEISSEFDGIAAPMALQMSDRCFCTTPDSLLDHLPRWPQSNSTRWNTLQCVTFWPQEKACLTNLHSAVRYEDKYLTVLIRTCCVNRTVIMTKADPWPGSCVLRATCTGRVGKAYHSVSHALQHAKHALCISSFGDALLPWRNPSDPKFHSNLRQPLLHSMQASAVRTCLPSCNHVHICIGTVWLVTCWWTRSSALV